jgi:hypothetical protein
MKKPLREGVVDGSLVDGGICFLFSDIVIG